MKFPKQYLLVSGVVVLGLVAIPLIASQLPSLLGQSTEIAGLSTVQIVRDQEDAQSVVDSGNFVIQETSHRIRLSQSSKMLVPINQFLSMLRSGMPGVEAVLRQAEMNWDISYVPMMLEVARFLPPSQRAAVLRKLETQTGQEFGADFDGWMHWIWKQKFKPHPDYALFKSNLYSKIDPRFTEYFVKTENATIRLDEVRWGGVRRDGIPPLKNPKMLTAAEAGYLSDTDVVFGIELNGDARCYPKRILAWHEMFKDTIGGESVCGVY